MYLYRQHAPEGVAVVWVDPSRTFEYQACLMEGASAVISSGSVDILGVARLLPSLRLVQVNSAGTDSVVDEDTLIDALRTGRIAGAGLDFLQQEPADPSNPLLDMENVAITPHLASFAQEAIERSYAFAVQNAARVVNGLEPLSVVVPELGGPAQEL